MKRRRLVLFLVTLITVGGIVIWLGTFSKNSHNAHLRRLAQGATHLQKGNAFMAQSDYQAATEEYEKALLYRPEWDVASDNLAIARAKGESTLLDSPIEDNLLMPSDVARMHVMNALDHQNAGAYEAALQEYSLALAVFPGHADAYGNAGSLLLELGRAEEAKAMLEEYISVIENIDLENYPKRHSLGRGYFLLARTHALLGDVKSYSRTLRILREMGFLDYIEALEESTGVRVTEESEPALKNQH